MTYLFVPAHESRNAERAMSAVADVVIFDLEAAVPKDQKPNGRRPIRGVFGQPAQARRPGDVDSSEHGRPALRGRCQRDRLTARRQGHAPRAEDPALLTTLHAAGAFLGVSDRGGVDRALLVEPLLRNSF